MKTSFTGCLLLLCLLRLSAQPSFQKNLDETLNKPLICAKPDANGCYIASGVISNAINRFYLYSIDGAGNILWAKKYLTADIQLKILSIEATSDGVLTLFNTYTSEQKSEGYLLKFDLAGEKVWDIQIGEKNFTQLFEIQKDHTENIWLSALHLKTGVNDSSYYYLSKLDPNGNLLESRKNAFRYFAHSGYETCKYTDLGWNPFTNSLVFVEDFAVPYAESKITSPNRGRFSLGYANSQFNFLERFTAFQMYQLQTSSKYILYSGWTKKGSFDADKPVIGLLDETGKNHKIARLTPNVYQPIHSAAEMLVFYDSVTNQLIRFDEKLFPVWQIKLDNCVQTNNFAADIALDGSIYTIRTIQDRSIIARIQASGTSMSCNTFPQAPKSRPEYIPEAFINYTNTGYPLLNISTIEHDFSLNTAYPPNSDFCIRINADFTIPDTICLGTLLTPSVPDTSAGATHAWDAGGRRVKNAIPNIELLYTGSFPVVHTVQNGICKDTASAIVEVIDAPQIPYADTVICGPSSITLQLEQANAVQYQVNNQSSGPYYTLSASDTLLIQINNSTCNTQKKVAIKLVPFDPLFMHGDSLVCQGDAIWLTLNPDFNPVFWDGKVVQDSIEISDGAWHRYQARYTLDTACLLDGQYQVKRVNCTPLDLVFVPNVFSPNDDQLNDVLMVFPKSRARIRAMRIFDRWGNLVYRYTGDTPAWTGEQAGQKLISGIYAYLLEFEDLRDQQAYTKTGDILLIR